MQAIHHSASRALPVLLALAMSCATCGGDEATDLNDRLEALERDVAMLGADTISRRRRTAVRGVVQAVLADVADWADAAISGSAGREGGFFISAGDQFSLELSGQVQSRFVFNSLGDGGVTDEAIWGFEMRRTKLTLNGHVADPTWTYKISFGFGRGDGVAALSDAELARELGNGFRLRIGQFKGPFLREFLVSSKRQLAANRSLVNQEFSLGRMQGIELNWANDAFAWHLMVSDGLRSLNTAWTDADTSFAITNRAEWIIRGTRRALADFTSAIDDPIGSLLGAAAHVQRSRSADPAEDGRWLTSWTVDFSIEGAGANASVALVGRHREGGGDVFGTVLQAGYRPADELEVFGRWEWGDASAAASDLLVLTVGLTRYWAGHEAKWTTDLGVGFQPVDAIWSSGSAGWRTDDGGEPGQIVVRSQLQFLF